MPKVMRLTLFKLPDEEVVKSAIEMYNTLAQDAKKVRSHTHTMPPHVTANNTHDSDRA